MTTTINASTTAGLVNTADTSGVLALQTAGTTAVTIDASQNVGIGSTPTAIGSYKVLEVNGTSGAYIALKQGGTEYGNIYNNSTDGTTISASGARNIILQTNAAERMRIDSSGNVGIGTASPAFKLDVANSSASGTGAVTTVKLNHPGTTAGDGPRLLFTSGTSTTGGCAIAGSGVALNSADMLFYAGGNTERMRINSSGELLINTTSNSLSTKLFVNGSIGAQQTYGPMFISNENNTDNVGRGSFNFQRGGSTVGQIVTTNSTCAYNSVSDYRLKENIAPMIGALGKVAQLKPCTFTWKSNSFIGQGFIAHELQEVVPDCVAGEKDAVDAEGKPVYQGVDTSFLVATLTAAIQEQQALITQLQADVAALKGATP